MRVGAARVSVLLLLYAFLCARVVEILGSLGVRHHPRDHLHHHASDDKLADGNQYGHVRNIYLGRTLHHIDDGNTEHGSLDDCVHSIVYCDVEG